MRRLNRLLAANRLLFAATLGIGLVYSLVCVAAPAISGQMLNEILDRSSMQTGAILLFLGSVCCRSPFPSRTPTSATGW